jgi:hypothetical protein
MLRPSHLLCVSVLLSVCSGAFGFQSHIPFGACKAGISRSVGLARQGVCSPPGNQINKRWIKTPSKQSSVNVKAQIELLSSIAPVLQVDRSVPWADSCEKKPKAPHKHAGMKPCPGHAETRPMLTISGSWLSSAHKHDGKLTRNSDFTERDEHSLELVGSCSSRRSDCFP